MSKKNMILALVAIIILIATSLEAFDMNLTIRTILVTTLMAALCAIRGVIGLGEDDTDSDMSNKSE